MQRAIRTLIVDDEPIARRNLAALLAGDADIEIVGEAASGAEAVACVEATAPDLLFLDVQMPGLNGFEALARLDPERLPVVIFVTAYDQFALRAFEAQALDYLLKPFDDARFARALRRAKERVRQRDDAALSRKLVALLEEHRPATPAPAPPLRFLIKTASRVFFVQADEVDWIEAADYYVKLHVGPHTHMLRERMADLEERLDARQFLRVHRSAIVNLRRVLEVRTRDGEYFVVLQDGVVIKLSRRRREQLERILDGLRPAAG